MRARRKAHQGCCTARAGLGETGGRGRGTALLSQVLHIPSLPGPFTPRPREHLQGCGSPSALPAEHSPPGHSALGPGPPLAGPAGDDSALEGPRPPSDSAPTVGEKDLFKHCSETRDWLWGAQTRIGIPEPTPQCLCCSDFTPGSITSSCHGRLMALGTHLTSNLLRLQHADRRSE